MTRTVESPLFYVDGLLQNPQNTKDEGHIEEIARGANYAQKLESNRLKLNSVKELALFFVSAAGALVIAVALIAAFVLLGRNGLLGQSTAHFFNTTMTDIFKNTLPHFLHAAKKSLWEHTLIPYVPNGLIPVAGITTLLALAGIGYGIHKMRAHRKEKRDLLCSF